MGRKLDSRANPDTIRDVGIRVQFADGPLGYGYMHLKHARLPIRRDRKSNLIDQTSLLKS
jgi:hypothetical protein